MKRLLLWLLRLSPEWCSGCGRAIRAGDPSLEMRATVLPRWYCGDCVLQ